MGTNPEVGQRGRQAASNRVPSEATVYHGRESMRRSRSFDHGFHGWARIGVETKIPVLSVEVKQGSVQFLAWMVDPSANGLWHRLFGPLYGCSWRPRYRWACEIAWGFGINSRSLARMTLLASARAMGFSRSIRGRGICPIATARV